MEKKEFLKSWLKNPNCHKYTSSIMLVILVIVLLFFFNIILSLFFIDKNASISDQAIHNLFIDLIRKNKHRFITSHDRFILHNKMMYPQLLHWLFSFLPKNFVPKISLFTPLLFSLASLAAFVVFAIYIYPYFDLYAMPLHKFILFSGLLFISTPYSYNIINAKNMGISARGFGLLLGQVYTYCIVLYLFSHSNLYLYLAGISTLLIFMSNIFATQYVLFITVIMIVLYKSTILILPFIGAIILFLGITPKVAYLYFKLTINHKILYYKYFAKSFLLVYREGIWKDVFYEIWRLLFTKNKPKGGGSLFMYIYTNPVIILIFSLPLALPITLLVLLNHLQLNSYTATSMQMWILVIPVISSLLLFFLFSFRITRFLGEPERYVEFTIGLIAIMSILVVSRDYLYAILIFQTSLVLVQAFLSNIRIKKKIKGIHENIKHIEEIMKNSLSVNEEERLLSNNTEVMRLFTHIERKVLFGFTYSEWHGKYHHTELYPNKDSVMNIDLIIPIIQEYKINYFILDLDLINIDNFETMIQKSHLSFHKIANKGNLIAYKIC